MMNTIPHAMMNEEHSQLQLQEAQSDWQTFSGELPMLSLRGILTSAIGLFCCAGVLVSRWASGMQKKRRQRLVETAR